MAKIDAMTTEVEREMNVFKNSISTQAQERVVCMKEAVHWNGFKVETTFAHECLFDVISESNTLSLHSVTGYGCDKLQVNVIVNE